MFEFCRDETVIGTGPTRRTAVFASLESTMTFGARMLLDENTTEQTAPHRLIEMYTMACTVDKAGGMNTPHTYTFRENNS